MAARIGRREFLLTGAGATAALLYGTGVGVKPVWAQTPSKGGTLNVALNLDPPWINSSMDTSPHVQIVSAKIYEGLVGYTPDLEPMPGLAESWEVSPDGKQITFNLRQGVKWHDGEDFTSEDVAFSVLTGFGQLNGMTRAVMSAVTEVQTPDPHTAVFVLSDPTPHLMRALPGFIAPIIPKHIFDTGSEIRENPANQEPVGTGPFKFVEWQRGSSIVLERNPDHWDADNVYLDGMVFQVIPDAQARSAAVESGNVDMVFHSMMPANEVRRLEGNPDVQVSTDGYGFTSPMFLLDFNLQDPILSNAAVRRGIAHAIDLEFILQVAWGGFGTPARSHVHPNLTHAYTEDTPTYPFDPAMAEKLLDGAGLPRGEDGLRATFNCDYVPGFGDAYPRTAQYLQQALAEIGIKIEIQSTDPASWVKRIWTDRDWQIHVTALQINSDPSIGLQRALWSKNIKQGAPFTNSTFYSNPEADRLFEAAATELDPERRKAIWVDLQQLLMTDIPTLPLVAMDFYTVADSKLRDFAATGDGVYSSLSHAWFDTE